MVLPCNTLPQIQAGDYILYQYYWYYVAHTASPIIPELACWKYVQYHAR
jgi:hypothetical protein